MIPRLGRRPPRTTDIISSSDYGFAIIVTYNSAGQIEACPAVLQDVFGWQRLLFDNPSQDDSVERAQYADPPACVIKGFQTFWVHRGSETGCSAASGRMPLFVNPDAIAKELEQGLCPRLAAAYRRRS